MANLISMAGKGKRYSEVGYRLPKPLIPVQGEPMIYRLIECLPESDKWIFILNQDHIDQYQLDRIIKKKIPNAIITVDKDLLGQASIFCAEQYLNPKEEVFIAACDMAFVYNQLKLDALKQEDHDLILWTFTQDKRITANPTAWGYVIMEDDQKTIKDMSVKIPISGNPFNDHVVAAAFWIKDSQTLFHSIRLMIEKEIKTNDEYYLDNLPLIYKLMNKKSVIFDVDIIVSWGTPSELQSYDRIVHEYRFGNLNQLDFLTPPQIESWKKYFEGLNWNKI